MLKRIIIFINRDPLRFYELSERLSCLDRGQTEEYKLELARMACLINLWGVFRVMPNLLANFVMEQ